MKGKSRKVIRKVTSEEIVINESNVHKFITGSAITLTNIVNGKDILQDFKVKIENIKFDNGLSIVLNDLRHPRLNLEIRDCEFLSLLCTSTLNSIWIRNSILGKTKEDKIIFSASTINDIDIFNTTINADISIKENSIFDKFQISTNLNNSSNQIHDHGIYINKSSISEFSIENIVLTYINLMFATIGEFCLRNSSIEDSVNFLSSNLRKLEIENSSFLNKNQSTTNWFKRSDFNTKNLESIHIIESTFPFDVSFNSDVLNNVVISKTNFRTLSLEYFDYDIELYENDIQGYCNIGVSGKVRDVNKLIVKDNIIDKDLKIGPHAIGMNFELGLNTIKNGRIEHEGIGLFGKCNISRADY